MLLQSRALAGRRASPAVAPTCTYNRQALARPARYRGARDTELRCRAAVDSGLNEVSIADLEAELKDALGREDYKAAARLRDTIQQKSSVAKLAVEDANRRFYDAFMSGRLEEMDKVVGLGDHVQCIHPGAGCIAGREQVMDSWRTILRGVRPGAFRVALEDVRVFAREDMGFVTCVEVIDADDSMGRISATNVFERQNGVWRIVQHHGSPSPRFR
ncbi:hypothetical protein HYH03_016650 [Edaphochlamys debaryana]|uniref:UVR domain-containing protein n=1 Tax=Edaphochlamys debaryana TaxID=47281 RepID=A0A835XJV5_9CHLO|nr:hypothetical protein HYH03_016650 [Edaphochlamys debaryana]|eukprot:KAG2484507.1 hypothetical protein HYH03_016650 [Edaphochlamys debaryana]